MDMKMLPLIGETRIRGHSLTVKGRPFRTQKRRNIFSQGVVNLWNSLTQKAMEALSVFKTERLNMGMGIKDYGGKVGEWG